MRRILLKAIAATLLTAGGALADKDEPTPNPVDSLTWLAGHWQGEAFGGTCEEVWSPPSAGTMVGTFKLYIADEVKFYELMTIAPGETGPELKVKHFNADLTGWEEKDQSIVFPFVEAVDRRIKFDGITYERTGPDSLVITVQMHGKDGSVRDEVIRCRLIGE